MNYVILRDLRRWGFWCCILAALFVFPLATAPSASAAESVTGRLTESDGTTLTYGSVTLRTSNWSFSQYQSLDSNGNFTFTNISAGTYLLDIWTWSTTSFPPKPMSVTVTDGQSTSLGTIALLAPNVFGRIVKSDGTTLVTSASITIRTSDWSFSRWANVDANGNFKTALVDQGDYIVETYTWDSTESRPDNTTITYSGSTVYLDGTNGSQALRMNIAGLRGRITIPGGIGAQYASISLLNSDNVGIQWASTDTDGYFKIDSVASGTYKLRINPPYAPAGLASPDDLTVTLTKGTLDTTYLTNPIALTESVKRITGQVTRGTSGTPISDASISAWQPNGWGWASTTTDSNGNFSFLVSKGGTWELSIWPSYTNGVQPNWTYTGGSKTGKFLLGNAETETQIVNFSVATLSATLQGTLTKPDGTPINGYQNYASVSVWSEQGYGGGGWSQVDLVGWYSIKLAPGTYTVSAYGSSEYGSPQKTITIKENETLTENIAMLARDATITGFVQDDQGHGIANQWCSAWKKDGWGWASASSGSDGRYSMDVTAGTWYVNCYPSGGTQGSSLVTILSTSHSYVSTEPPQEVTVAANGTVSANFLFDIADATISGKLVDLNGTAITSVWGWVNVRKCSSTANSGFMYYGGLGGSISGGIFSLRVPNGCWRLQASVGYAGDYSSSSVSAQEVTIGSGETVSDIQLQLIPNNATITGSVVDANGETITDAYGSVFLTDGTNYRWTQITEGAYTLKAAAGNWTFGCWLDQTTTRQYYMNGVCERTITAVADATVTENLTLQKTDSTIAVSVKKPNGDPLPNAHVSVSTSFGSTKTVSYGMYGWWFKPDRTTDQNGEATFQVPAGTYFVSTSISTEFGWINPEKKVVTVSADAPGSVELRFVEPDAIITGTVTKDGVTYTGGGTVSAYNTDGGYSETTVGANGEFSLPATKEDRWVASIGDDGETTGYTSGDVAIDVPASGTATATIALDETVSLPTPTTTTFATNTEQTVSSDGVSVNAPANSLSATSVDVTLSVTGTVEERPSTATDSPIGPAYDITATQSNGQNAGSPITDLAGNVTVTLPYADADLTSAGVDDESTLTVKSWDSTTDTYTDVQGVAINEQSNTVSFTTNHLSKFVITTVPVEKSSTPPQTPGGSTETPIITPDIVELKTRNLAALYGTTGPTIVIYRPDGKVLKRFRPYGTKATGDFKMIATDVLATRDGEELVVYSPSKPSLPIKIFTVSGKHSGTIRAPETKTVELGTADLDGDGISELTLAGRGARSVPIYRFSGSKIIKALTIKPAKTGTGLQVLAGKITSVGSEQLVIAPYDGDAITVYSVNLRTKKSRTLKSLTNLELPTAEPRISLGDISGSALQEVVLWPRKGEETVRILGLDSKQRFKLLRSTSISDALGFTLGDVDGNGKMDILAVTTTKGKSTVKMFSVKKNASETSILSTSLDPDTKLGKANLAVGDFNADGVRDVILTHQNSTLVTIYSYQKGKKTLKRMTSAYVGSRAAKNGYSVAATDTNGDGRTEIVLASVGKSKTLMMLSYRNGKIRTTRNLRPSAGATGPFILAFPGAQ